MKFSVLLPTRNRLEYLRYAVETVRRQDYANWEIVVSDNDSEEDIKRYIAGLNDERIRYFRTDRLIPVTENWNCALGQSNGDYVVMLGDDDGLLPGYFSALLGAFNTHPSADYVYVGGYYFAYHGAVKDEPEGFLRRDSNQYCAGIEPHWLNRKTAHEIAGGYLAFRMPVASNMQFSLISRRMIDRLSADGPFFRSPYPDFYATPLLFLLAEKILICPAPMVVVGITPKSYGAFHGTDRVAQGVKFLGNEGALAEASPARKYMLPGTSYYDSWLLAMESLRKASGGEIRPNYQRYRFLQIVHGYKARYFDRRFVAAELRPLCSAMTFSERMLYGVTLSIGFTMLRVVPGSARRSIVAALRRLIGQHAIRKETAKHPPCATLLDVYEAIDRHHAN